MFINSVVSATYSDRYKQCVAAVVGGMSVSRISNLRDWEEKQRATVVTTELVES